MPRPIRAEISLAALRHNYRRAKQAAPDARVFAVVKANAYGHGIAQAVAAWGGADGFATLELDSAISLRAAGITAPILLLEGFFDASELPVLAEHGLWTVVHSTWQAEALAAARRAGVAVDQLEYFLKLNTGMNRLGLDAAGGKIVLDALRALPARRVTLMTHFSDADGDAGVTHQMTRLAAMRDELAAAGPPAAGLDMSVANSAAMLRYAETHGAWVRPGIILYGASPFTDESAAQLGLQPAMTLRSRIIAEQHLAPGSRVGYGGMFAADRPMRVGIVACGYADGYPRHAPSGTPLLVDGVRTRTVGRVSMDMLTADLTDLPAARTGSDVTLWGEGMPIDEVAHAADTKSYELMCGLAARVPVIVTGA